MLRFLAIVLFAVATAFATALPSGAAEPTDPAVVVAARAKVGDGDTLGAIRDLQAYVPTHVDDVAAARLLGDLYYRTTDMKRAEKTWKTILARFASDRETHNRLGSLYSAQDRIEDAIAEFEKSLPIHSGYYGLVAEHRRLGDLTAFENDWREKADQNRFNAGAQAFYGNILRAERRRGGDRSWNADSKKEARHRDRTRGRHADGKREAPERDRRRRRHANGERKAPQRDRTWRRFADREREARYRDRTRRGRLRVRPARRCERESERQGETCKRDALQSIHSSDRTPRPSAKRPVSTRVGVGDPQ